MVMPRRPREHELEQESIDAFKALLPRTWIMRRKDQDYGVDLEVEIFDADKLATGLVFNVQLKGTDDPQKARSVTLRTGALEYFDSLKVPTLVVRYGSPEESIYSQWHPNLRRGREIADDQQSFTYTFSESERWAADTPAAIERTLRVMRAIETAGRAASIPIELKIGELDADARWIVEGAVHDVIESAPDTLRRTEGSPLLSITIEMSAETCRVGIDCLTSCTFGIDAPDRAGLATQILYAIAMLLTRQRLSSQAERVARALLERGESIVEPSAAFDAVKALAGDLGAAVELAILNGLHRQDNAYFGPMVLLLMRVPQSGPMRDPAVERFYDAARNWAHGENVTSEAAACYSYANFCSSRRNYPRALRFFNEARKLRPEYCRSDYFLGELGACLFGATRYRSSANVYALQAKLAPSTAINKLHLGDALLFSGQLAQALEAYQQAIDVDTADALLVYETSLKSWLSQWLINLVGTDLAPARRTEAIGLDDRSEDELRQLLREVDALHELIHFNLGVNSSRNGQHAEGFPHFLLCAFKQSGDDEAWANAIICAVNSGNVEGAVATMASAISLRGREAYDHLRALLIKQKARAEALAMLDDVARQFVQMADARRRDRLTIRALGDDETPHIMEFEAA